MALTVRHGPSWTASPGCGLEKKQRDDAGEDGAAASSQRQEWRLALEGFGRPEDFQSRKDKDGGCAFLAPSRVFISVTPFLAAGHLKDRPDRYQREIRRLLRLRGLIGEEAIDQVLVETQTTITVGGRTLRPLQFHRFRSTRGEQQHDTTGAFLKITLPMVTNGPLCLGYGSHFGLGLFKAADSSMAGCADATDGDGTKHIPVTSSSSDFDEKALFTGLDF